MTPTGTRQLPTAARTVERAGHRTLLSSPPVRYASTTVARGRSTLPPSASTASPHTPSASAASPHTSLAPRPPAPRISVRARDRLGRYGISPSCLAEPDGFQDFPFRLLSQEYDSSRLSVVSPADAWAAHNNDALSSVDRLQLLRVQLERTRLASSKHSRPSAVSAPNALESVVDQCWNMFDFVWNEPSLRSRLAQQDLESLLLLTLTIRHSKQQSRYALIRHRMRALVPRKGARSKKGYARHFLSGKALNQIAHGARRSYFKTAQQVFEYLNDMRRDGLVPNTHSYSILIAALGRHNPSAASAIFWNFTQLLLGALRRLRHSKRHVLVAHIHSGQGRQTNLGRQNYVRDVRYFARLIKRRGVQHFGFLFATAIRFCGPFQSTGTRFSGRRGGASSTGDLSGISLASPYKSLKRHVVDGLPSEGLRIYDLAVNLGLASHPEVHAAGVFLLATRGLGAAALSLEPVSGARGIVEPDPQDLEQAHTPPISFSGLSSALSSVLRYRPEHVLALPAPTAAALLLFQQTNSITGVEPDRQMRIAAVTALLFAYPAGPKSLTARLPSAALASPPPEEPDSATALAGWLVGELGLAQPPERTLPEKGARGLDRIREVLVEIATAELVAVQHEEAARLHKAPQAYEATSSSGADDIAASYRYPPPRRRASRGLPWRPSAAVVDRAVLLAARAGRRDLVTALVPGLAALVDLSPEAFEAVVDLSVNDAVAVGCSECMRTAGADVGNVAVHRERWGARGALNALQALAARRGPAGVHWRAYAAVLRARVRAGSERPDSALRLCRMAIDAGMGVHPEVRRLATLFEHW